MTNGILTTSNSAVTPDAHHKAYDDAVKKWQRADALISGEDAVRAAKETYLPKPSGMPAEVYEKDYIKRAPLYGASARTLAGLEGMAYRKPPIIEPRKQEAAWKKWLEDVDNAGSSSENQSREILRMVLAKGSCGVLVDHNGKVDQADGKTLADVQQSGERAFCAVYPPESILNWRHGTANGRATLTMVCLLEESEKPDPQDRFKTVQVVRVRVCELLEGIYTQTVYIQEDGKSWKEESKVSPMMNGKHMVEIPFFAMCPSGNTVGTHKAPLEDLFCSNITHYQWAADEAWARHLTAHPTPFFTGVVEDNFTQGQGGANQTGLKVAVGGMGWSLPHGATAAYMEVSGTSAEWHATALKRAEEIMAALGARMLAPEKSGVEAQKTVVMRHNGEMSIMQSIVINVSAAYSQALRLMLVWNSVDIDLSYEINKDFLPSEIDPAQLQVLLQALQSGAMSYETFYSIMTSGEITRTGVTAQEELEQIAMEQAEGLYKIPVIDEAGAQNDKSE